MSEQRRGELIEKEIETGLSPAEIEELRQLQNAMLKRRRRLAPRPLDDLRALRKRMQS